MDFEWNKHRFSGGILVLDLTNTLVYRNTPDRRLDRLDSPQRFAGFAEAASKFRCAETGSIPILAPEKDKDRLAILNLRQAADRLFRPDPARTVDGTMSATSLQKLFSAASGASRAPSSQNGTITLGLACALSAMRLLASDRLKAVRACPNCNWLFIDNSKNASRRWCDMAVCGNRAKAAKHYRNKTAEQFS